MLNCVIWLCGIRSHLRSSIGPTLGFLVRIAGQTVDVLVAKSPDDGARFKFGHHVPEEFLFRVGWLYAPMSSAQEAGFAWWGAGGVGASWRGVAVTRPSPWFFFCWVMACLKLVAESQG